MFNIGRPVPLPGRERWSRAVVTFVPCPLRLANQTSQLPPSSVGRKFPWPCALTCSVLVSAPAARPDSTCLDHLSPIQFGTGRGRSPNAMCPLQPRVASPSGAGWDSSADRTAELRIVEDHDVLYPPHPHRVDRFALTTARCLAVQGTGQEQERTHPGTKCRGTGQEHAPEVADWRDDTSATHPVARYRSLFFLD